MIERFERRTHSLNAGRGGIGQQVLLAAHDHTTQRGRHCAIICIGVCLHHRISSSMLCAQRASDA
jgi:hypothetical protein